jgi:hypothetical protein
LMPTASLSPTVGVDRISLSPTPNSTGGMLNRFRMWHIQDSPGQNLALAFRQVFNLL